MHSIIDKHALQLALIVDVLPGLAPERPTKGD